MQMPVQQQADSMNIYNQFMNGRYATDDNQGFLNAFKGLGTPPPSLSGLDYIKDGDKFDYANNINNSDTGSIRGSDAEVLMEI